MNVFLPGAGFYHLGRRRLGAGLAVPFLAAFAALMVLFISGYSHYLSTALSDDLLKGDTIEQLDHGFHTPWMLACAGVGIGIYAVSTTLFAWERRRLRDHRG